MSAQPKRGYYNCTPYKMVSRGQNNLDSLTGNILENLDTPAYKIASFELTDLQLIAHVARKGKPILISTGMGNLEEISEAIFE